MIIFSHYIGAWIYQWTSETIPWLIYPFLFLCHLTFEQTWTPPSLANLILSELSCLRVKDGFMYSWTTWLTLHVLAWYYWLQYPHHWLWLQLLLQPQLLLDYCFYLASFQLPFLYFLSLRLLCVSLSDILLLSLPCVDLVSYA